MLLKNHDKWLKPHSKKTSQTKFITGVFGGGAFLILSLIFPAFFLEPFENPVLTGLVLLLFMVSGAVSTLTVLNGFLHIPLSISFLNDLEEKEDQEFVEGLKRLSMEQGFLLEGQVVAARHRRNAELTKEAKARWGI